MDHTDISGIDLLLILVDSFSGWPEVVCVHDRKTEMIKQILQVIFLRNGVLKTLVSGNSSDFSEVGLCTWLRKIRCTPYKTPPYHLQSNGIAERKIGTVKIGLNAFEPYRDNLEIYLLKLLMSQRLIPHAEKVQNPSALLGRQIRTPITMSFSTNEMWYKKSKEADPECDLKTRVFPSQFAAPNSFHCIRSLVSLSCQKLDC